MSAAQLVSPVQSRDFAASPPPFDLTRGARIDLLKSLVGLCLHLKQPLLALSVWLALLQSLFPGLMQHDITTDEYARERWRRLRLDSKHLLSMLSEAGHVVEALAFLTFVMAVDAPPLASPSPMFASKRLRMVAGTVRSYARELREAVVSQFHASAVHDAALKRLQEWPTRLPFASLELACGKGTLSSLDDVLHMLGEPIVELRAIKGKDMPQSSSHHHQISRFGEGLTLLSALTEDYRGGVHPRWPKAAFDRTERHIRAAALVVDAAVLDELAKRSGAADGYADATANTDVENQ
jgi:hypothetical protein